jgi:hypothetical protein
VGLLLHTTMLSITSALQRTSWPPSAQADRSRDAPAEPAPDMREWFGLDAREPGVLWLRPCGFGLVNEADLERRFLACLCEPGASPERPGAP